MVDLQVGLVVPGEGGPDHWDSVAAVGISGRDELDQWVRTGLDRFRDLNLRGGGVTENLYPLLAKLLQ